LSEIPHSIPAAAKAEEGREAADDGAPLEELLGDLTQRVRVELAANVLQRFDCVRQGGGGLVRFPDGGVYL
jgi:hypothetical protein